MSCSAEHCVLPLAGVEEYVSVPLKFLTEIVIFTSSITQSRQGSVLSTVITLKLSDIWSLFSNPPSYLSI